MNVSPPCAGIGSGVIGAGAGRRMVLRIKRQAMGGAEMLTAGRACCGGRRDNPVRSLYRLHQFSIDLERGENEEDKGVSDACV